MKDWLKKQFKYRALWKHQKNRNKQLTKRINRLTKNVAEDLKLDVTNEEIRKLKSEVNSLKKQVIKANLEAQKYFDTLMDLMNDERILPKDNQCLREKLKAKEEVIKEAREYANKEIRFVNMQEYENLLEILSKGENK